MLFGSVAVVAQQQQHGRDFIPVEGASLTAKLDTALRQAKASGQQQTRFWTAYSFDVRPGVAVDFEFVGDDGNFNYFSGASVTKSGVTLETRNLAVFILRAVESGAVTRIDVYNLERRREYSGYPVYWAGRASNDESLNLLRGLTESKQQEDVAEQATRALALHDDRRVADMLEALARNSSDKDVRLRAISWLGRTPAAGGNTSGKQNFLLELARNERESVDIRRQAVSAFGAAGDATTLAALQSLYTSVSGDDLKRAIISSVARHESRDVSAVNFLIKVATTETDMGLRKKALAHLGEKAGEQSLGALADIVTKTDPETEIQKQAVNALSRRPNAEAVPLLIKLARTHAKPEIRRQAMLLLGRTGDEQALNFLKEILTK